MPVRELNDRVEAVRMTTQRSAPIVVIGLMTTTASAFPTLAHGLATLDGFPIAGALQIAPDQPGVDFDALERARAVLVQAWRNDLTPDEITVTQQGGITIAWRRAGWALPHIRRERIERVLPSCAHTDSLAAVVLPALRLWVPAPVAPRGGFALAADSGKPGGAKGHSARSRQIKWPLEIAVAATIGPSY